MDFLKKAERLQMNDGSTAITIFQRGSRIWVANVGDSRAVLATRRSPAAVPLSYDHKPNRPEERRRIAAAGGRVVNCFGVPRVNGVLAVRDSLESRAPSVFSPSLPRSRG